MLPRLHQIVGVHFDDANWHRNHKAFAAAYNFLRFHDDRSRRALAAAARRDDDGESSSDGDGAADASPEEPEDVDAPRALKLAADLVAALAAAGDEGFARARDVLGDLEAALAPRGERPRAPRTFTDAGDAAPVARGGGDDGGKPRRASTAEKLFRAASELPGDASPAPSPSPRAFLELHFDTPGDGDEFSDDGSHHHGDDPPQAREATSSGPGA